ncbi:hypothetical protein MFIFM68171_08752 [Madurella fahalii]|uniref:G domain-containing protein n=1 Tax=Madurella fahalii TaxID=1157608 RepID=A0ABQ0GLB4_9PEZI
MPYTFPRLSKPLDLNSPNDDFQKDVDTAKIVIEGPSTEVLDLPESCDKFRILIIGKAGVGKSTICSKVFGIPPKQAGVSHYSIGTTKDRIWHPITFEGTNENLILHDSGGFEAGDMGCVNEITKFINFRKTQHRLADQLHCIWYCISCSSNRPIQEAELEFFQKTDVGNIPVVVVFTQFDKLVDGAFINELRRQMNSGVQPDIPHIQKLAYNAAVSEYVENYLGQFERTFGRRNRVITARIGIRPGDDLDGNSVAGVGTLVKETREILLEDGLKLLWTAAQAHSADMKLQSSMEVGMSVFWNAVGFNSVPFVPFIGATALYKSFTKILAAINTVWRIPGCNALIQEPKNRNLILQACFDVTVLDRIGAQFLMAINIFGPLTASQTASVLLKLIAGITLLYESIFWEYKDHPDKVVDQEMFGRLVYDFQKSKGRQHMSSRLTAEITSSNSYSKEKCMRELQTAVDWGRNEHGKSLISARAVAGQT